MAGVSRRPHRGWAWSTLRHTSYGAGTGCDGVSPEASLLMDRCGALYGATAAGAGTVFQLTPWRYGRRPDHDVHRSRSKTACVVPFEEGYLEAPLRLPGSARSVRPPSAFGAAAHPILTGVLDQIEHQINLEMRPCWLLTVAEPT
jgi:hypothetical protein